MISMLQNSRYLPHTLDTGYHAVKTYRGGASVAFAFRRYKVSKVSQTSSPHPNSHTEQELTWIKNCIRRTPNATLIEIFYKLNINKGYHRHPLLPLSYLEKTWLLQTG